MFIHNNMCPLPACTGGGGCVAAVCGRVPAAVAGAGAQGGCIPRTPLWRVCASGPAGTSGLTHPPITCSTCMLMIMYNAPAVATYLLGIQRTCTCRHVQFVRPAKHRGIEFALGELWYLCCKPTQGVSNNLPHLLFPRRRTHACRVPVLRSCFA